MRPARNIVLVVENDAEMRDLLLTALSHAGFETLGASSARQALAFLDAITPCAIVADFLLPDMDGVELLELIRWRRSQQQMPTLMLTAAPEAAGHQLFRAGLDVKVFAKPVALDQVIRQLADFC